MTLKRCFLLAASGVCLILPNRVTAQEVNWRLQRSQIIWLQRLAATGTAGVQEIQLRPGDVLPGATGSVGSPEVTPEESGDSPTFRPRRADRWRVSMNARLGFDKQITVLALPVPSPVNLRRRYHQLATTAEYRIGPRDTVALIVPYVSQSTTANVAGRTVRARGRGVGDTVLWAERAFVRPGRGTRPALAVGVQMPTGKAAWETSPGGLPTGTGFYQGLMRISVSQLKVPMIWYASLDYGRGLSRTVGGQKLRLPASYGMDGGVFYNLGPEWQMQTGLSWNKVSSPFILGPGSTVAYLTQAINYRPGDALQWRGGVDIGLTEESTDVLVGVTALYSF